MCSHFILSKTIQDVTGEILFELDQIVFPFIPFEVKEYDKLHVVYKKIFYFGKIEIKSISRMDCLI